MNLKRMVACFTGVLSMIMLAEAWLLAAGVEPISAMLPNASGGLPDCNMSDSDPNVKCVQHPNVPNPTCVETYTKYSAVKGQKADLLVSETEMADACLDSGCDNIEVQQFLGAAPTDCKKKLIPEYGI